MRRPGRHGVALPVLALLITISCPFIAAASTSTVIHGSEVRGLTISISEAQHVYDTSVPALTREILENEWSKTDIATQSTMAALYALGVCGCLQIPTSAVPAEFSAPKQHGYPLSFEAEADEPSATCRESNGSYKPCP